MALISELIILDNSQAQIINNNKYEYLPHIIMNYKDYHQCLYYDKEDFFPKNNTVEENFYWKELFLHPKINLNLDNVGKILSVNHELWDLYVPCIFMILEYKQCNTHYLFVSTHISDKQNGHEQIKLFFAKEMEQIFDFMEKEPDLICHIDSEFYEKQAIMSYLEVKALNNKVLEKAKTKNIVKVKI
jgi:hypothetical protein